MRRTIVLLSAFFAVTVFVAFGQAEKPLTNEDVIRVFKGGLDEQTVIKAIEASGGALDTPVDGPMALKGAGISDKVITAVLSASSPRSDPPKAADPKSEFDEIGIYVFYKDKTTFMEPEIVTMRTGGVFTSAMTYGIASAKVNL